MIYGEYQYTSCMRRILAFNLQGVKSAFALMQEHLDARRDGYFVGYLTYEAGVLLQTYGAQPYTQLHDKIASICRVGRQMQDSHFLESNKDRLSPHITTESAIHPHLQNTYNAPKKQPLLYFALFAQRHKVAPNVSKPHKAMDAKQALGRELQVSGLDRCKAPFQALSQLKPLDSQRYFHDFDSIKACIARGESYQINYTQETHLVSQLDSEELFRSLCEFQHTPYKAYIQNAFATILCFSPELFFEIKGDRILAQPMKGTMRRYEHQDFESQEEWVAQDEALKQALRTDSKNCSENIMIVDLLRNDLSKVLVLNSLRVRELCAIHTYPSLHQMVSTLEGELRPHTNLLQVFEALFPCGSVTGAPKLKSMELIHTLESRLRGVYCGALGVISCEETSMCVPIRTLVRYPYEVFYRYGVGSGVVWDSQAQDEFAELILKSHFLKATPLESFALFETMLYKNGKIVLLREHLERLLNSMRAFGFDQMSQNKLASFVDSLAFFKRDSGLDMHSFVNGIWENGCVDEAERFFEFCECGRPSSMEQDMIVRLVFEYSGDVKLEFKPYISCTSPYVALSHHRISHENSFVYHKSTQRDHFIDSQATEFEVFDWIYANQEGELCEGSRSNLILELDGVFYTPHLQSGLLQGTLRRALLESRIIEERKLEIQDLRKAQSLWCINSVRGVVRVWLKEGNR